MLPIIPLIAIIQHQCMYPNRKSTQNGHLCEQDSLKNMCPFLFDRELPGLTAALSKMKEMYPKPIAPFDKILSVLFQSLQLLN